MSESVQCSLSWPWELLLLHMVLPMLQLAPSRLLNSSCSLDKTLQCSCSFHGTPTPSVQWWIGDTPVSVTSEDDHLRVTSTRLGPWANSTLSFFKEPALGTSLLCEGKNQHGTHALSILLMSRTDSGAPQTFLKAMLQGAVYGTAMVTMFFLCLLPYVVKHVRKKHVEKSAMMDTQQIPKAGASQESKMPIKEEPGTSRTTPSPGSPFVEKEKNLEPLKPLGSPSGLQSPLPLAF